MLAPLSIWLTPLALPNTVAAILPIRVVMLTFISAVAHCQIASLSLCLYITLIIVPNILEGHGSPPQRASSNRARKR